MLPSKEMIEKKKLLHLHTGIRVRILNSKNQKNIQNSPIKIKIPSKMTQWAEDLPASDASLTSEFDPWNTLKGEYRLYKVDISKTI